MIYDEEGVSVGAGSKQGWGGVRDQHRAQLVATEGGGVLVTRQDRVQYCKIIFSVVGDSLILLRIVYLVIMR